MELVRPGKGKSRITRTGGSLEIVLPSKKNIFVMIFLPIWLCGWAFGAVMVSRRILAPGQNAALWFSVFWLIGWIFGGLFALSVWLWSVAGKETVTVNSSIVRIKKGVGQLGISKAYNMQDIKNLRVIESDGSNQRNPFDDLISFLKVGVVAFDYGMQTFRFGSGIDVAEAKYLLEMMRSEGYFKV